MKQQFPHIVIVLGCLVIVSGIIWQANTKHYKTGGNAQQMIELSEPEMAIAIKWQVYQGNMIRLNARSPKSGDIKIQYMAVSCNEYAAMMRWWAAKSVQ